MMTSFKDELAAEVATEYLEEKRREEVEAKAKADVDALVELLAAARDGDAFGFEKKNEDETVTYRYIILKSGGRWYRTNDYARGGYDDAAIIVSLVGLKITADDLSRR